MGVVVFDSDVLIGFLNKDDAHHARAVDRMRGALQPGTRRLLSAVNQAEILVGPVKAGREAVVEQMLLHFSIETVPVDAALARRAATVRARTGLKLPDAFAVATAVHAGQSGSGAAALETFDARVGKAYAKLRSHD